MSSAPILINDGWLLVAWFLYVSHLPAAVFSVRFSSFQFSIFRKSFRVVSVVSPRPAQLSTPSHVPHVPIASGRLVCKLCSSWASGSSSTGCGHSAATAGTAGLRV